MTILRTLAATLLLLPILALSALGQDAEPTFPEPLSDSVSDFAQALNATEEGRITRLLADIRETTGVQIVVVTTVGLDGLNGGGMRLETFGKALFDAWGVGDKKKNDGVLILIDTNGHEARITLGSGYDRVYDDRAARVLATTLLPELRAGRLAQGIEAGVLSVRDRLVVPFLAGEPIGPLDGFEPDGGTGFPIEIGVAAVFGLFGLFVWRRVRARNACPNCGAGGLKRTREVISAPTKFQQGLGLLHRTCDSCGFNDRISYPIRQASAETRRSREDHTEGRVEGRASSGAESGGFGGGESDGGGAGSKW